MSTDNQDQYGHCTMSEFQALNQVKSHAAARVYSALKMIYRGDHTDYHLNATMCRLIHIHPNNLSKHMSVLQAAGLVECHSTRVVCKRPTQFYSLPLAQSRNGLRLDDVIESTRRTRDDNTCRLFENIESTRRTRDEEMLHVESTRRTRDEEIINTPDAWVSNESLSNDVEEEVEDVLNESLDSRSRAPMAPQECLETFSPSQEIHHAAEIDNHRFLNNMVMSPQDCLETPTPPQDETELINRPEPHDEYLEFFTSSRFRHTKDDEPPHVPETHMNESDDAYMMRVFSNL